MTAEKVETDQEFRAQPAIRAGRTKKPIPPLKPGEKLTRDEFERRYHAMPHIKKAELIEGVVYMPSPVRTDIHGRQHFQVITWLGFYCASTPGVDYSDNGSLRLEGDNEPQPDVLLRIDEKQGGNSRIGEDGYIEGGPELIVEIAGTSADYDLGEKLAAYRRHGVKEYIVWQTQEAHLDWFQLVEGAYVSLKPDSDGIIESQVFPGLRLAVNALMAGDLATVLSELQRGIQTSAHQKFVEQLSKA